MLICKNIKNQLIQVVQEPSFLEFANSMCDADLFVMPDDIKVKTDTTDFQAIVHKKHNFPIIIDLATRKLLEELSSNFSGALGHFFSFQLDVHFFKALIRGQKALIFQPDIKLKYFQKLLHTKPPFRLLFNGESADIVDKQTTSVSFSLTASEIRLLKEFCLIFPSLSTPFIIFVIQKSLKKLQRFNFSVNTPDEQDVELSIFFRTLQLRIAKEIYDFFY